MIAMLVEDMLIDSGATVVGPAGGVTAALDVISSEEIDGALLDVNLGGEQSFDVADALAERSIPFVFVTGYGGAGVRDRYPNAPTLQKPFVTSDLEQVLTHARGRGPGRHLKPKKAKSDAPLPPRVLRHRP